MKHYLAVLALTVFALTAAAQAPVEERVDVNLVLLDVTVTDRAGNQILGLGPEDFVVSEDGVERRVDSVDYFTNRRLLTTPEQQAAFRVERIRSERYFIFLFHRWEDPEFYRRFRSDLLNAKTAARKFIDEELLPEDRVAIAGYDLRLKIFSDFTGDRAQLRKALDQAVTFSMGIRETPRDAAADSILANIDMRKMINGTGRPYDALTVLADATRRIPARKVLFLFSPGIGEVSDFSPELPESEEYRYLPTVRALQKANVTVYPIHLLRDVQLHATEQTLIRLATDTGGDYYRNIVGFIRPLKEIEKQNNGYYMLSYYVPAAEEAKGGYRKLSVSLRNPEFKVKARKGRAAD